MFLVSLTIAVDIKIFSFVWYDYEPHHKVLVGNTHIIERFERYLLWFTSKYLFTITINDKQDSKIKEIGKCIVSWKSRVQQKVG